MPGQDRQDPHPAQPEPQASGRAAHGQGPSHSRHEGASDVGHVEDGHGRHSHEHVPHSTDEAPSAYDWKVYHPFEDVPERAAVEVSPRRGLIARWRFVVPQGYKGVRAWGVGAPGGGPLNTDVKRPVESGPTQLVNGPAVIWFGGHETLSSRLSAYLVFEGEPPHYLAFGEADEPGGPPLRLEGITFSAHDHPPLGQGHEGHGQGHEGGR